MSFTSIVLNVPASATTGTSSSVRGLEQKAVQIVIGLANATYDIQASLDGTNFANVPNGTGLTGDALVDVPFMASDMRVDVTAWVAGAAAITVAADNPKSS